MLRLRPTIPEDVPGVLALVSEIYESYGCRLDIGNVDRHLLDPGAYFRGHGGEFWVVEDAGTVRATVGVLIGEQEGELKTLYVHPSIRRQGWGRRLSNLVIDYARRALVADDRGGKRKPRIVLWTDTRFLDAHRLYTKMGFTQFATRELHDINNTTEYGMQRALD